jgi:multidrug efflux pump subunit AcrB
MNNLQPKGAIAWMAANPVAANLLMLVFIIGGLYQGWNIKQEVFPSFELDMVTINASYPGASPAETEQGVILPVENAVSDIDGVKEISARAAEGSGSVYVEMLVGTDAKKFTQDIQSAVNRIRTFPDDVETPRVYLNTRRRQVLSLMVYGDVEEPVLRTLAENIRDRLLQSEHITQADLSGAPSYEISIQVSQSALRTYHLTLDEIAAKIRKAAIDLPGGGVKTAGGEILLRMTERRNYGQEFAHLPILSPDNGAEVRLGDIAIIIDGFADDEKYTAYNGKRAVEIDVYRVGRQTPIEVSRAVHEIVDELNHTLPPGIQAAIRSDRSDVYRQRIDLLLRNAYIGLFLVLGMLSLFLEIRLAFWVTMGIPISFMGALLVLPFIDVSINMVTLFAFIIALGIVVDDAIVVGENIFEHRQINHNRSGRSFLNASVSGAREVAMPVVFSIITNVITFMPLVFISGIMGKIFWMVPAVVAPVFIISLVESLYILPAHLAHQNVNRGLIESRIHDWQQRFSRLFVRLVRTVYLPFLKLALRQRYLTLASGLSVLLITLAYVGSGRLGMTRFPRVESDRAVVTAILPYGSSMALTGAIKDRLVQAADAVIADNGGKTLSQGILARIGRGGGRHRRTSGGHVTEVVVYLTPSGVRPVETREFTHLWRKKAGSIPGLESISFSSRRGGPGSGAALTLELSHRNLNTLEAASGELATALARFPAVTDIDDGFALGKEQFNFQLRPQGRALGLTAQEVARQVRNAFYGAEVLRQQRGRHELKVMVRLPSEERASEYDIESLLLRTPAGHEIPLNEAVTVTRGRAYTVINRREGRRVVNVTADVNPPSHTGQISDALKSSILPELRKRHAGLQYSFEGSRRDITESMNDLKNGFLMAMVVIYGVLAVAFRSYVQPIIIMVCIPFGIIGAVIGHLIMGYSLSLVSMMGMVALSGVVVNDSLVLINFANREHKAGKSATEAILSAGVRRFRPIILTTLTTFGGLAPMIFETSRQARFLIPMALSLGYGILFATVIALILVPCLYLAMEDVRNLGKLAK